MIILIILIIDFIDRLTGLMLYDFACSTHELQAFPTLSHIQFISSLAVSPDSSTCLVTSNNRVMEHQLETGKYTQFSREEVVLDKEKQIPEPSSKFYFTNPLATPDTDLDSSGLRMTRNYKQL